MTARRSSPSGTSRRSVRTSRLRRCQHSFFSIGQAGEADALHSSGMDILVILIMHWLYVRGRNWWWLLITVVVCGEDSGCTRPHTSTWWTVGAATYCPLCCETWYICWMTQVDPRLSSS
jgi:hypothetical protein